MKNVKKLLSIVMVLTLVLSLGASAFATDVTIKDDDAGSTYTAYELFSATYNSESKLYQYKLNTTFAAAIKAGLEAVGVKDLEVSEANESKVVDAISKLAGDDVRTFADAAFKAIQADNVMKAAGKPATGNQFSNLSGYYLIAETVHTDDDADAVTSLVMLNTVGAGDNLEITTKEDKPSSEKKVKDKDDFTGEENEWQDGADYDIGDSVPYQLKAKIQSTGYEKYETYSLKFVDTLSKGLTYEKTTAVYYIGTDGQRHDLALVEPSTADYAGEDETYEGGKVLTWSFADLKTLNVPAGATVYVEYTAKLEVGAVIGPDGNPNEMYIEYSNNPYGEGTGTTPEDKVTVFTYELDVKKVDGAGEALDGAGFTLYKVDEDGNETAVGEQQMVKAVYKPEDLNEGKPIEGAKPEKYVVDFKGLDAGKYVLKETTVPEGYNKAADVTFTVEATYDTNSADPQLNALTINPADGVVTADPETGIIDTTVVNLTGVELPSTGGIGTTIFYVVGAILVAGAVILLVSRKRASGAEK